MSGYYKVFLKKKLQGGEDKERGGGGGEERQVVGIQKKKLEGIIKCCKDEGATVSINIITSLIALVTFVLITSKQEQVRKAKSKVEAQMQKHLEKQMEKGIQNEKEEEKEEEEKESDEFKDEFEGDEDNEDEKEVNPTVLHWIWASMCIFAVVALINWWLPVSNMIFVHATYSSNPMSNAMFLWLGIDPFLHLSTKLFVNCFYVYRLKVLQKKKKIHFFKPYLF
ncbi:hypothetical protein RFI_20667, partial [Reticulomyxa filosa]